MTTAREHFGGGRDLEIGANFTLNHYTARWWSVTATTTGLHVKLPDATNLLPGGPVIEVHNDGTNTFDIQDNAGNVLVTALPAQTVRTFWLRAGGTQAGTWSHAAESVGAAVAPTKPIEGFITGGSTGSPDTGDELETRNYSALADTWTDKNDSLLVHRASPGFVIGSQAYFYGSSVAISGPDRDELLQYDPDTWTNLQANDQSTVADDENNAAAQGIAGLGLVFGGRGSPQANFDRTDEYDQSGDSWSQLTALGTDRWAPASETDDTYVWLVAGGVSNIADVTRNDRYDISGDSFSVRAANLSNRGYCESAFLDDVFVLVTGRTAIATALTLAEGHDDTADSWSTLQSHPGPARWGAGASTLEEKLYCYGGNLSNSGADGTSDALTFEYDEFLDSWTAKQDMSKRKGFFHGTGVSVQG